jgi:peptide-methionine (R)-S-oxide reductase
MLRGFNLTTPKLLSVPILLTSASHFFSSSSSASMSSNRSAASNTALPSEKNGKLDLPDAEWQAKLSRNQYYVLRQKGTDPARRGEYDEHFVPGGVYVCAACATPLYLSEHKFDCGCGWPGFWTNLSKQVREQPETDRSGRVEIVCNACNSHLGHLFRGEGFSNPAPNERHCVNSTSIKFIQKPLAEVQAQQAKNSSHQ